MGTLRFKLQQSENLIEKLNYFGNNINHALSNRSVRGKPVDEQFEIIDIREGKKAPDVL